MLASVAWLNRYLSPANLSPDEAVAVIERTSFPIDSRVDLPPADARLDVELTSNRGDAFSHLTLAREIAAATGRKLVSPPAWTNPPAIARADRIGDTTIINECFEDCPRFTARIIRGVKVGPSPAWLREALEAVNQRSINTIVDATNFVLLELGHPSHAFDLNTLASKSLRIRRAMKGETLAALTGQTYTLTPDDIVVADAARAVSLAGIVGGTPTSVTDRTTDILLEVATWNPAMIRATARRLGISTDAAYRFERTVDPRDLHRASARLVELILELAGGAADPHLIDISAPLAPPTIIALRPQRCRSVLGIVISTTEITRHLTALGFGTAPTDGGSIACTVPPARSHDVTREIDIIEEVGRIHGIDNIPLAAAIPVRFDLDHPKAWSRREGAIAAAAETLTALGHSETITVSFLPQREAAPFCPPGLRLVKVDEERRRENPFLRPSAIPSLLTCRRANRDRAVTAPGGFKLFEISAIFADHDDASPAARRTAEHTRIAILNDLPDADSAHDQHQLALRTLRGTIETLAERLGGLATTVSLDPCPPPASAYTGATCALVRINTAPAGHIAILPASFTAQWDLDAPIAVADLALDPFIAIYPPRNSADQLPRFPAIERDLSILIPEHTTWAQVHDAVSAARLPRLEHIAHIATYRGKQAGAGRKSVTMRLRFRDAESTLRREDADAPIDQLIGALGRSLAAEVRR